MIKKAIHCKDCDSKHLLFVKLGDVLVCPNCESTNLKILYKPLPIQRNDELVGVSIGELTQDYIDENKQILDIMKQEKIEWKS